MESSMKRYVGDRTIDGVKVTVDGKPLDPATSVAEYSKNGFEWSYEGHLGDKDAAKVAAEDFMQVVVANFDNEWEMTSDDIDLALTALPNKAA
jgi:hypothetical protein